MQLLALCTDAIDGSDSDGRDILTRAKYRGEYGNATPALVDTLQHLQNTIYDHHRPLPVPTTILIDGQGNLRGFYKGSVSTTKLCEDVDKLASNVEQLPLEGTWIAKQGTHNVNLLTEELFRDGYQVEATAFVERLSSQRFRSGQLKARLFLAKVQSKNEQAESVRQLIAVLKLDPNNATAHEQMGLLLARAGRPKEAMHHFEQAVAHSPTPAARTFFNYAKSLRTANSLDNATKNLDLAIKADPSFAPAYEQRGLIQASQSKFKQAAQDFAQAIDLEPKVVRHRVNAAMALARLQQFEAAWEHIAPVAGSKSPPKPTVMLGAQLLKELNRQSEAIELLERYLLVDSGANDVRRQLEELQKQ